MEKWPDAGRPHAQGWLKDYSVEFLKDLPAPNDYEELFGRGGVYYRVGEKALIGYQ